MSDWIEGCRSHDQTLMSIKIAAKDVPEDLVDRTLAIT